jgi:hypothetical protein
MICRLRGYDSESSQVAQNTLETQRSQRTRREYQKCSSLKAIGRSNSTMLIPIVVRNESGDQGSNIQCFR